MHLLKGNFALSKTWCPQRPSAYEPLNYRSISNFYNSSHLLSKKKNSGFSPSATADIEPIMWWQSCQSTHRQHCGESKGKTQKQKLLEDPRNRVFLSASSTSLQDPTGSKGLFCCCVWHMVGHQNCFWTPKECMSIEIQVILAKPRAEVSKKGEAYRKWLCHIQFNLSVILLFYWDLYFCTKRFYCHVLENSCTCTRHAAITKSLSTFKFYTASHTTTFRHPVHSSDWL